MEKIKNEFKIIKEIGNNDNIVKVYRDFSWLTTKPKKFYSYIKMDECDRNLENEVK